MVTIDTFCPLSNNFYDPNILDDRCLDEKQFALHLHNMDCKVLNAQVLEFFKTVFEQFKFFSYYHYFHTLSYASLYTMVLSLLFILGFLFGVTACLLLKNRKSNDLIFTFSY